MPGIREWIGRALGFLRSAVFRHGAWMVSGAGVQAAVAFGANLVLVRLLLPEHFGRFAIIQANISVITAVTNIKIGDLLLREPEEELDDSRLSLYFGALGLQSAVVVTGALCLLWTFDLLGIGAAILLAAIVATQWVNAEMILFERKFDYQSISVIETAAHGAGHVFAVIGALFGIGAIVLYLRRAVQVLCKFLGLAFVGALRSVPLRWLSAAEWKEVFLRIREFWVDGVLAQLFERLTIVVVGALVGERVTGFFYQARRLARTPHQLAQPITSRITLNYFSHHVESSRRRSVLREVLSWEVVLLTLVAAAALVLADPVVPWLFGETWEPVVPLFRAMSGVVVGLTVCDTLNAYYMALGRLRPFVLFGRGGQYAGMSLGLAAAAVHPPLGYALGIALGLSAAYLVSMLLSGTVALRSDLLAREDLT